MAFFQILNYLLANILSTHCHFIHFSNYISYLYQLYLYRIY